jgi:hypothetical protein
MIYTESVPEESAATAIVADVDVVLFGALVELPADISLLQEVMVNNIAEKNRIKLTD